MEEIRVPFNAIAYYQAGISIQFMRRHNLTPQQFLELDKKYKLLHFLEIGYEVFHLSGDEAILEDLDDLVYS
jgi:hypothetical protein